MKGYFLLMGLFLSSIQIKYAGSGESNPFTQSTVSVLIFVIAAFSHFLTYTAANTNNNSAATAADRVIALIFHLSGIVGCESLLWILVAPHLLSYCLTNMFVLASIRASFLLSYCLTNMFVLPPLVASIWASFLNSTAAPVTSNENDEMPTATSTAEEQV